MFFDGEGSTGCDHILFVPLLKGSDSFWESQNQMHVTGITASKVTPICTSGNRGRSQAKLKGNFPWRLLDHSTGVAETCMLLPFHLMVFGHGGVAPLGLPVQASSRRDQLSALAQPGQTGGGELNPASHQPLLSAFISHLLSFQQAASCSPLSAAPEHGRSHCKQLQSCHLFSCSFLLQTQPPAQISVCRRVPAVLIPPSFCGVPGASCAGPEV